MRIRRIFVPPEGISREGVVFPPKTLRYLIRVLRLEPGKEVEVFDGSCTYRVKLVGCEEGGLHGVIVRSVAAEPIHPCDVTLAFGCVRPGPFEEILRHCTELGVLRFVPILTSRTARRPDERKERWDAVVASAAAQSGRVDLPAVESPMSLNDFLASELTGLRLVLSTRPNTSPLLKELERSPSLALVLLVGPEGGFEPAEEDRARSVGFVPVNLGSASLRTETAAVVSVGAAAAWFNLVRHRSEIVRNEAGQSD
ncbi:MAG: 16S rRNA (uracil(1498)-N(3))-methyltransferase [Desulfomonile sp.]|nr:16S rRNA (uracil(1498)-N(3))-methyltransferase [Desulfomonile sp.]